MDKEIKEIDVTQCRHYNEVDDDREYCQLTYNYYKQLKQIEQENEKLRAKIIYVERERDELQEYNITLNGIEYPCSSKVWDLYMELNNDALRLSQEESERTSEVVKLQNQVDELEETIKTEAYKSLNDLLFRQLLSEKQILVEAIYKIQENSPEYDSCYYKDECGKNCTPKKEGKIDNNFCIYEYCQQTIEMINQ